MNPSYKPEICLTFKEYKSKYDSLLKEFLNEHEDYGEIYFFEREREFYAKCHASANITSVVSKDGEIIYSINNGITIGLIPEIYKKLLNSSLDFGFDFDLSEKYKATFKSIINFLDGKIRQYSDAKNSMGVLIYPPIPAIVDEKPEKSVNPYPRIFKNYDAFLFFEKLRAEFGNTKLNLSNYSFVYHRMLKDGLIFTSILQLEFIDFLAIYDIHISRIKGFKEIGKKQLRESVYNSAK